MRSCANPYFLFQVLNSVESSISTSHYSPQNVEEHGIKSHYIVSELKYMMLEQRLRKTGVASIKMRRVRGSQHCLQLPNGRVQRSQRQTIGGAEMIV